MTDHPDFDLLAETDPLALRDAAYALQSRVNRLTAGESHEPRDPGVERTPGQWIAMWNAGSAEDRLAWAASILDNSRKVSEYFQLDYKDRALHAEDVVARLREGIAEANAHGDRLMDRLAERDRDAMTIARVRRLRERLRTIPAPHQAAEHLNELFAALDQPDNEEEETTDELLAAFDAGQKSVTAPPGTPPDERRELFKQAWGRYPDQEPKVESFQKDVPQ